MKNEIKDQLIAVRTRQQFARGFQWGAVGLLVGASVGCVVLILQRSDLVVENTTPWVVAVAATVCAFAAGLVWPLSWSRTAQAVDQTYGLKDRSLTAMDFAGRNSIDDLQDMQIVDALQHMEKVAPERVVPFHIPRFAPAAVCTLAVMLGIMLVPGRPAVVAKLPEALPVVLEQAELLEDTMLEELKDLAEEHEDGELQDLAEEIEEAIEELKSPEVDQKEALAKLSEMQQAVAESLEQLDVEQIDAQLEQLAQALEAAEATEAASQALRSQQYDKAATELEKIDASTMSRKERDAVQSNLAKMSKQLGEGKQGELSEAVSEMLEGLEKENMSQCKGGMCKAAGVCKKQGLKKKISQCLSCQLNRLSECKSCCQCNSSKPSNKWSKSKSPSNSWGTAATGQATGEDKTNLDSKRREESITGIAGEGPSERETLSTPEARQDAARSYQKRYAEFKKQMESVLDSEPLPLGHRQTVRTYFESIRPENGSEVFDDAE